jgi:hypothetical protein
LFHSGNRAVAHCCILIAALSFPSWNGFSQTPQTGTSMAQSSTPTKNVSGEGTPNELSVTPELEDKYEILSSGPEPEDILPIRPSFAQTAEPVQDGPVGYTWTDLHTLLPWWQTVTPETLELEYKYPTNDVTIYVPYSSWLPLLEPTQERRGTRELCSRTIWHLWLRRCTIASVVY